MVGVSFIGWIYFLLFIQNTRIITMNYKVGKCIDCAPDAPAKPLIAKRCEFHYKMHRNRVNAGKKHNVEKKAFKKDLNVYLQAKFCKYQQRAKIAVVIYVGSVKSTTERWLRIFCQNVKRADFRALQRTRKTEFFCVLIATRTLTTKGRNTPRKCLVCRLCAKGLKSSKIY